MNALGLGTVQFGLDYGATNTSGSPSDQEIDRILEFAHRSGIELLDTAADYGTAQLRLGQLQDPARASRYVSKFSFPPANELLTPERLFGDSMESLRVDRLYGLLFHRMSDLSDPRFDDGLSLLRAAQKSGLVNKLGVSVYNSEDLDQVARVFPDVELIQLPANILDMSLLEHPFVIGLKERGGEVHVRSALLQGILLADPDLLSDFFAPIAPTLRQIRDFANDRQQSLLGTVLSRLKRHPSVDVTLVGANTLDELRELVDAWGEASSPIVVDLRAADAHVLDPRKWPRSETLR